MATSNEPGTTGGETGSDITGSIGSLVAAVVLTELVGVAVLKVMTVPLLNWYATLTTPAYTVPRELLVPVWAGVMLFVATAGWLAYLAEASRDRDVVLYALGGTLVLNAVWPVALFGLGLPFVALFVATGLWFAAVTTAVAFKDVDGRGAVLLVPYLAWVTYLGYVNVGVWLLN